MKTLVIGVLALALSLAVVQESNAFFLGVFNRFTTVAVVRPAKAKVVKAKVKVKKVRR